MQEYIFKWGILSPDSITPIPIKATPISAGWDGSSSQVVVWTRIAASDAHGEAYSDRRRTLFIVLTGQQRDLHRAHFIGTVVEPGNRLIRPLVWHVFYRDED